MVSIPYLPKESDADRLNALITLQNMGLCPMPHISARRIKSIAELDTFVRMAATEAKVKSCLLIAGDPKTPLGPFSDVQSLLGLGIFERYGIKQIGVAAHPEGHAVMNQSQCWDVLARKCQLIVERGMEPIIMTQFSFDAILILTWIKTLREKGIGHLVRIGVPGPASMAMLAKYAAMCGVSTCAAAFSKYGISIGRIFAISGPDSFVRQFDHYCNELHGDVRLHFFPFGGVDKTIEWIQQYDLFKTNSVVRNPSKI